MWTWSEYARNASAQTVRTARREAMSFFGKSQYEEEDEEEDEGNVADDEGDDDEEDERGNSMQVYRFCRW